MGGAFGMEPCALTQRGDVGDGADHGLRAFESR